MKNERFRLLHIIPWIRAISLLLTLIVAAIVPGCGANDDAAADFEDSTAEGEQAFTGDTNLALNKPATASSTTHGAYPSRAVDGNTNGDWSANSVVHTDVNINPWMQVDLQASPFIGSVVLWPRTDCCTDRLSNFRLRVSDDGTNWQDFFYPGIASPQATITVNRNARYVRVQLEGTAGRVLNIAEMQVFGPPNIAQGMTATQSSTTNGGVASRAVDGNSDGVWPNNSVTHTNVEFAPWWQVDLGSAQNVGGVEVYNRTDCCADRLSNFNLLVSDNGTTWTTFYYPGSSAKASFTLNRTARYVKVQLTGTNALSLAEVKVYAAATAPNTSTGVLALNDDVTSPIGAVEGDFSVDAQGAATYSFPIKVPPGTRNVEPKLSLAYRSGSGNGVVGTGWSLSGMPNVTRCPRTVAQDNMRGGVNGDTNDRFCLDGQRLIAIAGAYGAHGTEYRTEIETFSRVYSIGTCGTGPPADSK
jgi:hypothetical protein